MSTIDELLERIAELQEQVQVEFDKRRVRLTEDIVELQRRSKQGVLRYVFSASLLTWLTIPVIYAALVPMLLLDLFLFIYQALCFPVYRIPKVRRSTYLVMDRSDLAYLNVVEKINCAYCGYANGLMSYSKEIVARTEQYWCPIKHARRIVAAHGYYPNFFEFGDAESYRLGAERLRKQLADVDRDA
jgi:hypothetical protein